VDNEKCNMNTALAELGVRISLIDLAKARHELVHLFLHPLANGWRQLIKLIPTNGVYTAFVAPGAGGPDSYRIYNTFIQPAIDQATITSTQLSYECIFLYIVACTKESKVQLKCIS
jgi:hypothetical protein